MLSFQVKIDQETKDLLKAFIQEIETLNENLSDIKEMVAPFLGFRVIKKEEKNERKRI